MSKPITKYQDEILQALNLINQIPRQIHSKEKVEVRCAICKEVHSILEFRVVLNNFKKHWYGWRCRKCDSIARAQKMKIIWENKELADEVRAKMKKTWIDKYGVDHPSRIKKD